MLAALLYPSHHEKERLLLLGWCSLLLTLFLLCLFLSLVSPCPELLAPLNGCLWSFFYPELLAPWIGCFVAKLGYWRGYQELTSIQYCVVFLRDSLLPLLAAMADAWRQELLDAQVPGPVVEEIVQLYGSKTVFKFSFLSADSLEKFAKTLLVKTKLVDDAGSDAADIHPALGALRAVHASLHSNACQPVEKVTEIQSTLLSTSMHAGRMHGGDREELRKQFAADYPGAGLNERVLPSLQYLRTIKQQCAQKAWEWLPWRKVLSEEQAMKLKEKRSASKLEVVDLLAHASGMWEESMEGEVGASPWKLQNLLLVRAHAFAFCGHGHMNLWWAYVDAFISAYTRSPPEGFRQPAIQEAEEADRRVLQEIFHLLYKGWTMDKALQCVIKEREAFRTQLVCVPRVSRKPVPKTRHQREGQSPPIKRRKLTCFDFQAGKCRRGKYCKYSHEVPAAE